MDSYEYLTDEETLLSPGFEQEPDADEMDDTGESEESLAVEEKIEAGSVEHSDAIKMYLAEIYKTKLLNAEEERALAARIDRGDKAARDKMVVSNLRLVVSIAKRYMNRGLPLLDLIEEGNLGLIKAVGRFKLSKECRFSTYATWWIRQSVERALVNQSRTIRLPVHVSDQTKKMLRVTRELGRALNREPTVMEVADSLEVVEKQVRKLMVLLKKTYSIDQPMGEHGDYFLTDTIEDTTAVSPETLMDGRNTFELLFKCMDTISEAEKKVLKLRFGLDDGQPQTLDRIGRSFGASRERIRQIEAQSLKKLRTLMTSCDDNLTYAETRH